MHKKRIWGFSGSKVPNKQTKKGWWMLVWIREKVSVNELIAEKTSL